MGGACARNSLEKCAARSPDGGYHVHIAIVYYISRPPLSQNPPSPSPCKLYLLTYLYFNSRSLTAIKDRLLVVLNAVCKADIRLAWLVYFPCLRLHVLRAYCTFTSKQAVSITLFGPRPNIKRGQCGRVVSPPVLKSSGPGFKSRSGHLLDLFSVIPSSNPCPRV